MKALFVMLFVLFAALMSAAPGSADTRLRSIMNELNMNSMKVVDGVMREDFALIESAALAIAEHEKAPMNERKRIVGYLKSRASKFKAVDQTLHNDAKALSNAAAEHDMDAVLINLDRVQRGCVACHTAFRPEVLKLFYK